MNQLPPRKKQDSNVRAALDHLSDPEIAEKLEQITQNAERHLPKRAVIIEPSHRLTAALNGMHLILLPEGGILASTDKERLDKVRHLLAAEGSGQHLVSPIPSMMPYPMLSNGTAVFNLGLPKYCAEELAQLAARPQGLSLKVHEVSHVTQPLIERLADEIAGQSVSAVR